MSLAFDLPQHLPRSGQAQGKATYILTKVDQATKSTLNAELAATWLADLDSAIQDTKTHISRRVHDDLPAFQRQLESAVSIQKRLEKLSTDVDRISEYLNEPKTGILPSLLHTLSTHRTLAEQANDADVTYKAVAHLLRTHEELNIALDWAKKGQLSKSSQACARVRSLIVEAPNPLNRSEVMDDISKRQKTLNNRIQEQLGDAYARSIVFSSIIDSFSLTAVPFTTVLPTSTSITLGEILCSLNPDSLSSRLTALRRDIISKFVEPVLLSSRTLTLESSSTLTLTSSSSLPLNSLKVLTTFLNSQIFQHLPHTHASFPSTFHSPITSAILTFLLIPSIPISISSIPSFLRVVDEAIHFEGLLLPADARDRPIKHWARDVAAHYEKKRREDILRRAREIVGKPEDGETVVIEVAVWQPSAEPNKEESGWDFDEEALGSNGLQPYDDLQTDIASASNHDGSDKDQEPSDGWGWGDEDVGDAALNSSSLPAVEDEDDPWGDAWDVEPTPPPPAASEPEAPKVPKMAKRLEKFSAKAKGLSASNTLTVSPVVATSPKFAPPSSQVPVKSQVPHPPKKMAQKDTYLVSTRAKIVLEAAEAVVKESQELLESNTFAGRISVESLAPGRLLAATAPSMLDLYRALYPVVHSATLASEPDLAMRWSNDCRYMSEQVMDINSPIGPAREKWAETGERLKLLGELCFQEVVVRRQVAMQNILVSAQGFARVAEPERFEQCKDVIEQTLREITAIASKWKVTLTRSSYLDALGQVVDDALFRVMDDILSLEDIPETDSERLSELCELMSPLEELFVVVPGEQSTVGSHVPLWFKFSYLSWLIKGSIADLSYLFDQGMLVDYEIDELVRLLRALFAETPLRENTIAKISKGHPISIESNSD